MKTCIIIFITLLIACNPHVSIEIPPEESRNVIISLADSLGTISITLPKRYDTSFNWTHYSDCNTCHYIKYRVQPKNLPLIKESGWYWREPKDSVERFTITHSIFMPSRQITDSLNIFFQKERQKEELKRLGQEVLSDTLLRINNTYYSIIRQNFFDTYDTLYKQTLLCGSSIKGNFVNLNFERFSKRPLLNDSFVKNAEYFLKTISIQKAQ